jgi:two-component system cell cycle sensor histidine kinase/response regulator CckA
MLRFLEWFLPEAVRPSDRDEARRALLTIAGCWIASALAVSIAGMQVAWGIPQSAAASFACAVVVAAIPLFVRATGRWRAAAVALSGLIWSASFAVAAVTGGAMAPALYYLVFAAAIASVTVGFRAGIALSLLTVAVIGGLYELRLAGFAFPVSVDPEIGLRSTMRGALLFNVALAALVGAYEVLRSAALRDSAENERRYRALADYGPDLIAEFDVDGRLVHSSAGGGALARALANRSALDAIHREDLPALRDAVRQLEKQPSIRVGPLRWLTSPTEWITFEASMTRFTVGKRFRVLVVARDVSARVALDAHLRQSQKMQAVGQLASGVAHDFNNVLMVISGYAELLESRTKSDPDAHAALEEVQRATEQGAALTRQLIALSRPQPGERRSLDLNALVRDNERMLRVLLGETAKLMLELAPGEVRVDAEPGELEQVLVNLAANARDALGPGGVLRIATLTRGSRAVLVVHDNGAGVDAATRERMFEPFFSTRKPGSGTGLGLYVVYTIVTGLGGEIEVVSDAGKGTRISIDLPLASVGEADALRPRRIPRAEGGSERILVVEDRAEVRTLVREALTEAGYHVSVAADGVEAIALAVGGRVDLVVSDLVMPRMGGRALIEALREKRPDLRAVFVSGYPADPADFGALDRLLRKPFRAEELRRAVRDALDA